MVQKITFDTVKGQSDEFIIAIGASAGGMEAIHTLFDYTPTDAVAYVIIQHLSPDHKSMMAELLAKHSKLKIFGVTDGMTIMPNCVYVMPEAKIMTISGGKLWLKDRKGLTPNSTIDIFFNSLAEDQGNKSIAIVLSGNGSDGMKGVAAIKRVGGMVIVQEPDSTDYDSMPNHVIESGNYDYILTPELIPKQIIQYVMRRTLISKFSDHITDTDEAALMEVINIIKAHSPLDFSEYKRPTVVRRIIRRVQANNLNTITEYIDLLKSNPVEIDTLSKDFLISVTEFFRDQKAFEIVRSKVIPEIIAGKLLTDTLKVWVIGCATGEEAYSIAILIKEHLHEIKKEIEVKIFASDIDKDALLKASKGIYHESKIAGMSKKRLDAFFVREGNGYRVRENIRSMIIFADHDIIHQPPYGKIDFISCRNMLIYFNPVLQKKIFSTIHFCLNVGGYLLLGPGEGVGDLKDVFQEIDKKWKIYKNIQGTDIGLSSYALQHVEMKQYTYPSLILKQLKVNTPDTISEIIFRSNMEESGFAAGVCLDEHNNIIKPFGNFEQYLVAKILNNNILELLPSELSIAVKNSINTAVKKNINVTVTGIKYMQQNTLRSLKILVKPFLHEQHPFQNTILLYFAEEEITHTDRPGFTEVFDIDAYKNKYVLDMEEELAATRKKLEAANLSLEEFNANIQSYNEELLSGNEEMQSSNEELQSINQELDTVNSEYQL
ncbi:MAG: chemotaxis protein CheR, partial [Cytophagales bacterium]|nr:chemotaxis protein CheR [Cytophaga sp.]